MGKEPSKAVRKVLKVISEHKEQADKHNKPLKKSLLQWLRGRDKGEDKQG